MVYLIIINTWIQDIKKLTENNKFTVITITKKKWSRLDSNQCRELSQ